MTSRQWLWQCLTISLCIKGVLDGPRGWSEECVMTEATVRPLSAAPDAATYTRVLCCGLIHRPNTVQYKVNRLVYYPFILRYNIFGQQFGYN